MDFYPPRIWKKNTLACPENYKKKKKNYPTMIRKTMKVLKVNFEGSVKHQEPNQTPLLKT